jgi:hypothetical protein
MSLLLVLIFQMPWHKSFWSVFRVECYLIALHDSFLLKTCSRYQNFKDARARYNPLVWTLISSTRVVKG